MKLRLISGFSGRRINIPIESVLHAESLGYESIWTSEAWGSDAVTPAAWILAQTKTIKVGTAIMQMPARTPAMAAMTAMTLADLSGGRFIVGLGASGPQVVEGWHGVPYGRPVTRLKEYVEIMKQIFARQGPASYDGKEYQLPYRGDGATGRANICFMISTYSFRRVTGRPYGTPCQPSTTWGPDAPKPTINRPPDKSANVIAVIAAIAGVLAGICIIAVPTLIVFVCAKIQAAGVTASDPQASDVQMDSYPRLSACNTLSIGILIRRPEKPEISLSFMVRS
jgi:hypothetical protein